MERKFGDRKDGVKLRNIHAMHFVMPLMYPNRCDNEAYISERIDLTAINAWLKEKNKDNPQYPYKLFNVIVASILKTITLRPKMNRFITNKNIYHRNYLSAAFTVKKEFSDNGDEALAFIYADENDTIETLNEKIRVIVQDCRSDKLDKSSESMDIFNNMPRFLSKFLIFIVRWLDVHGWVPKSLIASDPYYSSVVLSLPPSKKLFQITPSTSFGTS